MEPVLISLDITPKTPADREKLARALQALAAEDGNLEVRAGVEPDCTVIGATSEAHLEEIVDRLKREFEVEAGVGRPTVAYLETLTEAPWRQRSAGSPRDQRSHRKSPLCSRVIPRFGIVSEWEAEPEARLSFDDLPGEPRNADLAARDQFGGLQPTAAGAIMSRRG